MLDAEHFLTHGGQKGPQLMVLKPGSYYLNREAFTPTLIPTRAQTWMYIGGYEKRRIHLTVSDDGKIQQQAKLEMVRQPEAAVANPDIVKIPQVYVEGEGQGLEGAAATLGASTLMRSIGGARASSAAKPGAAE